MKLETNKNSELSSLYEGTFKEVKEGEIITGKIISMSHKDALVDIGYKSEGVIPLMEFSPSEREVGREIEVYVESVEDENGMVALSREKAIKLKGWDTIIKQTKEGDFISSRVVKKVKGGYIIEALGIEGFLPASLSSFKNVPDHEVIGREFKFKLLKVNFTRKSLIVSRKEAVAKDREEIKEKLWASFSVGEARVGLVKAITDFGAFIDIGGVDEIGRAHV